MCSKILSKHSIKNETIKNKTMHWCSTLKSHVGPMHANICACRCWQEKVKPRSHRTHLMSGLVESYRSVWSQLYKNSASGNFLQAKSYHVELKKTFHHAHSWRLWLTVGFLLHTKMKLFGGTTFCSPTIVSVKSLYTMLSVAETDLLLTLIWMRRITAKYNAV
jgi:hypothetical protein